MNEALRQGLQRLESPPRSEKPYRTPSFDAGRCLIGSIDNIAEVLALIEGEAYK